jgi:hypothetical protein
LVATGIVLMVSSGPPLTIGAPLVRTAGQGTYRIDGSLRDIVTRPHWHFVAMDGDFGVFACPGARGRAWVSGDRSATAHVVSDSPWGDETIRVATGHRATLVRSVQFSSGWQATVTALQSGGRTTGADRAVAVTRQGLVQGVAVPAGVDLVRFTYRPSRAYEGLALSGLGVLLTVLLAVGPVFVRRRRRRLMGTSGL